MKLLTASILILLAALGGAGFAHADVTPPAFLPIGDSQGATARVGFQDAYHQLGDIVAGRSDLRLFASLSTIQARFAGRDEVPNGSDPNAGRVLRPIASSSVIYGQLNLGYSVEGAIPHLGHIGVFWEADITDLRRETHTGRFGYGLYLAGPKDFRVMNYLNPTLALGYRPQADRCSQPDPSGAYRAVGCGDVTPDRPVARTQVGGLDITNFFLSLNLMVPIDCLWDAGSCAESNARYFEKDLP